MLKIKETEINELDFINVTAAVERWEDFPASGLSHHGEQCCRVARAWVLANDCSQLNGAAALTGPRWLRHKYTWGPSRWPIYWCEAVKEKTLDCGALAALAQEVFTARGVKSFPAQFIQQFSAEATCHWHKKWEDKECTVKWIDDDLIYHEGCAVVSGEGQVKLWDASAGWWLNPRQVGGYGGVLAVRFFTPPGEPGVYAWGSHALAPNSWQKLEARPISRAACG
jgi:hypothetical protein